LNEETPVRSVTIPGCLEHRGVRSVRVTVRWVCPVCGGPRGEPREAVSFDGTYRLVADRWDNPCGHVDKYDDVRREEAGIPSSPTLRDALEPPHIWERRE
jgi:hypothetical protein